MTDRFTKLGKLGFSGTLAEREAAKLLDVTSSEGSDAIGTCVVNTSNAGSVATSTVSGTDRAFTITHTPSATTPDAGVQCVVTFGKPYAVAPVVTLTAKNAVAANKIGAATGMYLVATATTVSLYAGAAMTVAAHIYDVLVTPSKA